MHHAEHNSLIMSMCEAIPARNVYHVLKTTIGKRATERLWRIPRDNITDFVLQTAPLCRTDPCVVEVGAGKRPHTLEFQLPFQRNSAYYCSDLYAHESVNGTSLDLRADATELPFKNSSVGTVLCTEVLEHIAADERVLDEVWRVLIAGGDFILTLPGKHIPNHSKPPFQIDYRRYDPCDVRVDLIKRGFQIEEMGIRSLLGLELNILVHARKKHKT